MRGAQKMKSLLKSLLVSVAVLHMLHADNFEEINISCEDGNAQACLEAGKIYSAKIPPKTLLAKHTTKKSLYIEKIAYFYKRSCILGDAEGCRYYAMHYHMDPFGDPKKSSKFYFQKACEMGDFTSCTLLKMMPSKDTQ